MPPKLPMRVINNNRPKLKKFSEFIGVTNEIIETNSYSGIYIDDTELFKSNFDLFKRILKSRKYEIFFSKDYECLKFIEDNLPDYANIKLGLVDDLENKDRSYISVDGFEKTTFVLPLVYSMWDVQMMRNPTISCYHAKENNNPIIVNGFDRLSIDSLKRIKDIVNELQSKFGNCSDIEKIILISNYLQNSVQYVDENNISEGKNGIYITDSRGLKIGRNVHSAENVLLSNYGVCEGIANATTMLLNNPVFNVNIRSARGSGHAWNVVLIDDKFYYVDNTWSITRNGNQYPESLKANGFTSEYLLFGGETASQIGHHIPDTIVPDIEASDYPQEIIKQNVRKLSKKINFANYNRPVFESKIQK